MKNLPKILYILSFTMILVLFCYFRLKPLYFQTVPYTYDQGRDFLKARQIVVEHHPALIGPTTGIPGVNHGVWWFYALTVPFILFGGAPIGFYYFTFLMVLAEATLFSLFLKREYGMIPSLIFLAMVTFAPYFIMISIFAISSVLSPLMILGFLYFLYKYWEKKEMKNLLLTGLFLGFLFESEMAFGIFLIPAFIASLFIFRKQKNFFGSWKKFFYFAGGAVIPMIPRIVYEVKSKFSQTRLALSYFQQTSSSAKSYYNLFLERSHLITDFFRQTFSGDSLVLPVTTAIFIIGGIVCCIFYLKKIRREYFLFVVSLFILTFLLSLAYKSTFWQNYFEGLPYFFALFTALSASAMLAAKKKALTICVAVYIAILSFYGLSSFTKEVKNIAPPKLEGLREQMYVAKKIYSLSKNRTVCVKVYTPPVIPYAYNYIFEYLHSAGYPERGEGYVNHTCYVIIEKEDCLFRDIEIKERLACEARIPNWKKINIPKGGHIESTLQIDDHVKIETWKNPSL